MALPLWLMSTSAVATAVEGEFGSSAAALLVVLGVWALLMGVRNLRSLRYKPMVPQRRSTPSDTEQTDDD